jgi:hypothetical protein
LRSPAFSSLPVSDSLSVSLFSDTHTTVPCIVRVCTRSSFHKSVVLSLN